MDRLTSWLHTHRYRWDEHHIGRCECGAFVPPGPLPDDAGEVLPERPPRKRKPPKNAPKTHTQPDPDSEQVRTAEVVPLVGRKRR